MVVQVVTRGAVGLDVAGRADVIRRDGVAESREHAGPGDIGDRGGLDRHAVEVRGLAHIGRLGSPLEGGTGGCRQRTPPLVTVEDSGVLVREHAGIDRGVDRGLHFGCIWPDVLQEDFFAVGPGAQRILVEIEVHRPG